LVFVLAGVLREVGRALTGVDVLVLVFALAGVLWEVGRAMTGVALGGARRLASL
jgi:hypothetical protein